MHRVIPGNVLCVPEHDQHTGTPVSLTEPCQLVLKLVILRESLISHKLRNSFTEQKKSYILQSKAFQLSVGFGKQTHTDRQKQTQTQKQKQTHTH